jgi:hypothetical protein
MTWRGLFATEICRPAATKVPSLPMWLCCDLVTQTHRPKVRRTWVQVLRQAVLCPFTTSPRMFPSGRGVPRTNRQVIRNVRTSRVVPEINHTTQARSRLAWQVQKESTAKGLQLKTQHLLVSYHLVPMQSVLSRPASWADRQGSLTAPVCLVDHHLGLSVQYVNLLIMAYCRRALRPCREGATRVFHICFAPCSPTHRRGFY